MGLKIDDAHISVLLRESIAGLAIKESGIYIDATFGRGGHSRAILEKLGPHGRLVAIDLDPEAIAVAKKEPFLSDPRFEIEHASFSSLEAVISKWVGSGVSTECCWISVFPRRN